ncbi:MAG: hypothetical protein AB8B87_20340 [Granulosicoccus sp.]
MEILNNWLLMAVITPTFWAMACVLDSCLIGSNVYRKASDGAIVSCLFCIAPAALALGMDFSTLTSVLNVYGIPVTAIAAGLAYAAHLFFYFRSLHCLNDVSGAETFIALSVLFVPFFAWVLLGERLPGRYYLAFVIAASGVLVQCWPIIRKAGLHLLANMLVTMVTVSLSMVLQSSALESHGFTASTVLFNLTVFLVAVVALLSNHRTRRRMRKLIRRYPAVLVLGEILGVLAVVSSHRATQQGPSVSIVALIECLLPLIIIAISSALILFNRYWPMLSRRHLRTLKMQLQGVPTKIGAVALLMISLSILTF